VTDTAELASRLLESDPEERETLLRSADPGALGAAIQALGHRRETIAAEVLAQVDEVVDDRSLRKAARRELHRLRSTGVEPPPPVDRPAAPAAESRPTTLQVSEALVTDIDPAGSRALWLVADRPLGGIWFAALLLNDQRGLQDLNLADTTRKRFERDFEAMQGDAGVWVNLPGPYSLQLVREGVDLSRELGNGIPSRYQTFRDQFGEASGPPERALVYETISPVEINFNPGWLEESPRLLGEPEVAGWYVQVPAELRTRALEVARTPSTGLVVPGHTPEEQAVQLVAEAAHQAFTPMVRRALRRRLEETAYVFLQTDRLPMARLAAAAAHALEDGGVTPERHPLMRLLLAAGLARLTGAEMVGSRRASEIVLDLVERASQQQAQSGGVETRPSGLILPR
jgi:hypothetical protein